jgi:hypothetical protein
MPSKPSRGPLRLAVALATACLLIPAGPAAADAFGPQTQITNHGPFGDVDFHAGFHSVAYNTATHRHLVVYVGTTAFGMESTDAIWGQFADDAGNRVGEPFVISETPLAYDDYNPTAVEYSPELNEWLVGWQNTDDAAFVRRLAADGTPLTAETPLATTNGDVETTNIAWNRRAGEYLVSWKDSGVPTARIFGRRVAATGAPLGADKVELAGNDTLTANDASGLVYNAASDEYLVVFRAAAASETEIYAQRLDATATRVGPLVRVSNVGPDGNTTFAAQPPSVAWNSVANQYLVAWSGGSDSVAQDRDAYGQLLDAAANPIGADDFRISDMGPDDSTAFPANRPRVAYNPNANEYMVTWHGEDDTSPLVDEQQEVFGQRLAADGSEVGTNDFRISLANPDGGIAIAANRPAIVYNANTCDYLVAWFIGDPNTGSDTQEWEIYGRRVDAKACPPASPLPLPPPVVPADRLAPAVSALKLTNKVIAVGKPREGKPKRKLPGSTTFRYRLSEAARVVFRIEASTKGRRVNGRCRKATTKNKARKACKRFVAVGKLTQRGKAGANSKKFAGKIGRRTLKPGRYRAVVTARDAAGNVSKPKKVSFKVVRP